MCATGFQPHNIVSYIEYELGTTIHYIDLKVADYVRKKNERKNVRKNNERSIYLTKIIITMVSKTHSNKQKK